MDARNKPRMERRIASHFIPLSSQAVIADLCDDPDDPYDQDIFADVAFGLKRHRHHDYRLLAQEVRDAYLPFNPDRDTVRAIEHSDAEKDAHRRALSDLTAHLLQRANFQRLSQDEITEILSAQSPYSLRIEVDLGEYDEMQVYTRDTYITEHSVRLPETAYLTKRTFEVRIFRRLFVLLKLKPVEVRAREISREQDIAESKALRMVKTRRKQLPQGTSTDNIYIKVFKDMPQHDLQILFPLRQVQFRPFDKIKFLATAGGGTAVGVFSTTGKLLAATTPIAAVGALIGFIGLIGRQVSNFFNQRNRYMMELAQKLFFHNIANNRAALTLLIDRAEEEDVKEDLIALYFFAGRSFDERELAARKVEIDDLLAERYKIPVDFELEDALSRLEKDKAIVRRDGVVTFLSLQDAAKHYEALSSNDDHALAARMKQKPAETEVVEET